MTQKIKSLIYLVAFVVAAVTYNSMINEAEPQASEMANNSIEKTITVQP